MVKCLTCIMTGLLLQWLFLAPVFAVDTHRFDLVDLVYHAKPLKFPVPEDYCLLEEDHAGDKKILALLKARNGTTESLFFAIPCQQLLTFRSTKKYTVTHTLTAYTSTSTLSNILLTADTPEAYATKMEFFLKENDTQVSHFFSDLFIKFNDKRGARAAEQAGKDAGLTKAEVGHTQDIRQLAQTTQHSEGITHMRIFSSTFLFRKEPFYIELQLPEEDAAALEMQANLEAMTSSFLKNN
jgi:hypothetical protein